MFKRIASDSLVYLFGALFNQAAGFLIAVVLMRHLQLSDFGSYSFALAVVMLFSVLSDGGLSQYVVRQINEGKEPREVLFKRYQGVQLLVSLALLVAITVTAIFMRESRESGLIMWLGAGIVISSYLTTSFSFFLAQGDRWIIFFRDVINSIARLSLFAVGIYWNFSLEYLCATGVMAQVVVVVFLLLAKKRRDVNYLLTFTLHLSPLKAVMAEAFPYTLLALVNILYNKVDVLMLKWLADVREVAIYAGATQFVYPFMFISTALMAAIFPMLTRSLGQRETFDRIHLIATGLLGTCGLIISTTLFLGSPLFYSVFFGDKFDESIPVYGVLVWYLALVFFYGSYSNTIVARGGVRFLFLLNSIMTLVNVGVNYAAIPRYGAMGAAVATIACEVVILLVLVLYYEVIWPQGSARARLSLSKTGA